MRVSAITLIAVVLVWAACWCSADPERGHTAAPLESTLVGQLLLSDGTGSRGVEVRITVTEGESRIVWVLFDGQGRFAHTFRGSLTVRPLANRRVLCGWPCGSDCLPWVRSASPCPSSLS